MTKKRKTWLVLLIIALQGTLAVIAGIAVLYGVSFKRVPNGVTAGNLSLKGLNYSQASEAIEEDYFKKFHENSIKLDFGNSGTAEIQFSKIGASIDGNSALDSVRAFHNVVDIPKFFQSNFGKGGVILRPKISYDENKLREELIRIAADLHSEPADAEIRLKDGIVIRKADTPGTVLNISNATKEIGRQLTADPWGTVELTSASVLQTTNAQVTMKDFDDIQQVFAEYTTTIMDAELKESIRMAADAIDGVILPPSGKDIAQRKFSFIDQLKNEDAYFENDNEGYDQLASTLYAAILTAGVPAGSITRMQHKMAVDYITPGLDSCISESEGDLRFSNPYAHRIAIFASVDEDSVTVSIAGSIEDFSDKCEITTKIDQRFASPVYYVENGSLKPGEKIVLNPGREGIVVTVYVDGVPVDTNQYEAEKSIVQVPPGFKMDYGGK